MTKTEQIKALHREGLSPSQIADRLDIRYQFAYNVLRSEGLILPRAELAPQAVTTKPSLDEDTLGAGGFVHCGNWVLSADGVLQIDQSMPRKPGVYAFTKEWAAVYVGVTLRTLEERMNLYRYGHSSQPANVAMRARLLDTLTQVPRIAIYAITPSDETWRGWPISVAAGVEVGIIKRYYLPWNRKGG